MKTKQLTFSACIVCTLLFCSGFAQGQSFPTAGSTGTPITFNLEWDCIHGDPQATTFWDFGSGATPAKASTPYIFDGVISASCSQVVTYSTPGIKTFTITTVSSGNSPFTDTFAVHIFDCSIPAIPHDAIVINSDTTVTYYNQDTSKTYWVNSGARLNLMNLSGYGDSVLTFFAEPGSSISGGNFNIFYMKGGSVMNSTGAANSVIFGDGASINTNSTDFTLNCPTLDFDYTNAPPNAAHPLSVKNDLNSVPITLSPNPTTGMLSVHGLPSDNITVSVFNIIGETVMVQKNPPAPDFTLDLSKLVPGTYYIRFSSANSVVTKKIIKN